MLSLPDGFSPEEAAILRAIYQPPRLWAKEARFDAEAVKRLVYLEWIEHWPGKAGVTFSEWAMWRLKLRVAGSHWAGRGDNGARVWVRPQRNTHTETDAIERTRGTDREFSGLDSIPCPRSRVDDDDHGRPGIIMTGCRAWTIPPPVAKRKRRITPVPPCEVCSGGTLAPSSYCGRCDRSWDDRAAKAATTERRVG